MKKTVIAMVFFLFCFFAAESWTEAGIAGDYFTVTPNEKAADINNTISLIEEINSVTYQSRGLVYSARAAYDNLETEEQTYVINKEILDGAEDRLLALCDIDNNGCCDGEDALMLRKMILGILPENSLSDVNGDGLCSVSDIVALKKLQVGDSEISTSGRGQTESKTEAERFSSSTGVVSVETGHEQFSGYSSDGYITITGNGSVEYSVSVLTAGYYDIDFVLGNTDGAAHKAYVDVNGCRYLTEVDETSHGVWSVCRMTDTGAVPLEYGIFLPAGESCVVVSGIEEEGEAISPAISAKSNTYDYEIEDGIYGDFGVDITTELPGFSGRCGVKLYDGSITMKLDVPETRYYNVKIRSCSYDGNNKNDRVYINGVEYCVMTPDTASSWQESDVKDRNGSALTSGILLNEGVNEIVLSANWGYCAYDQVRLETVPEISGMFIVPDLIAPVSTTATVWGEREWEECFARLNEVGIDTVIMQYTAQYWNAGRQSFFYQSVVNNTSQPSYQRNQVTYALKAAKEYGMKVYLGLQVAEDLWFSNMGNQFAGDFLSESAAFSQMVAAELWNQFGAGYGEQIAGWYLPFELNNKQVSGEALSRFITNYLSPVTEYLNGICDKPIMTSPLVYHDDITAPADSGYLDIWKTMCRRMWTETSLDIIAPQDGCGWESTCKENLSEWFFALYQVAHEEAVVNARKAKGYGPAQAWDNAESYNMNGIDQMPVNRLLSNMNAVAPYVSKFVSFSIHYFVPFASSGICGVSSDNKIYYDAYKQYYENRKFITTNSHLPTPENLSVYAVHPFDVQIGFDRVVSSSDCPVAGYVIKRKKTDAEDSTVIKIAELPQSSGENIIYTDYQLESGVSYTYYVYSFDAFGNRCQVPATAEYRIPAIGYESNREYTDVVSEGKIVAIENLFGVTADGNTQVMMTDGISGKKIIDWNADRNGWRGFQANGGEGSYDLIVSGLNNETYGYVYLSCLHQPSSGIYLPRRVDVYLGEDTSPIATAFPKQDYHVDREGNVFVGINLKEVRASDRLRIRVTQDAEWTMVSEVSIYGAEATEFANADAVNLAKGRPVALRSYSSFGNSFGFTQIDSVWKTYSATIDDNRPSISYYADATQTQMAGLQGMGTSYQMTVDLGGAKAVHLIGSRWIQDENLGIYIPEKVKYYGVMSGTGQVQEIATVYCSSKPQLDWTLPPNKNNTRTAKETDFKTLTKAEGQAFTQIIIEVYPKYTNGWTFFNNVFIY